MWLLYAATVLLVVSSAEGAAFLEDQLPLTVLQTTPVQLAEAAAGKQTGPITVAGRQALTVVYSRAVIALGSDFGVEALPASQIPLTFSNAIPGNWRWVTTYIARWVPTVDWPTDLNITLSWNTNLTAYDGAKLQLNNTAPVLLTTAPLSMALRQVRSERALNLTDNQWDATSGLPDDSLPEPPAMAPAEVYTERSTANASCISVRVANATLGVNGSYALILPAGTAYNPLAGPVPQDLRVLFHGLRYFRLPFNTDSRIYPNSSAALNSGHGLSYRRLSMWLVHGLANGTSLDDLHSAIMLEQIPFGAPSGVAGQRVPFNLSRPSAGTLQLDAPLQPSTQYRVSVADRPDILDGFGLPLRASGARFFMTKASDVFAEPAFSGDGAMVEAGTNWGGKWPVITQGQSQERQSLSAWPVTPARLTNAITAYTNTSTLTPLLGAPSDTVKASGRVGATALELDAAKALSGSGAALLQDCCSPTAQSSADRPVWLVETDMGAAFITAGPNITTWVTSLADGRPVPGAQVSFYTASTSSAPQLVANGTTDSNGTVIVSIGPALAANSDLAYNGLTAVVQRKGSDRLLVVNNVATSLSAAASDSVKGALVVDRLLAKPGDTLYVQGYVVTQSGATLSPAQQQKAMLDIPDAWTDSGSHNPSNPRPAPVQIPVTIDPTYGSFNASIPVPDNASPGQHTILLFWNTSTPAGEQPQEIAAVSITVGDPRPPTAALTLATPIWARYSDVVPVQLHAESYIGASVGGAQMQLGWRIGTFASGNQSVTVDSQGDAVVPINLNTLNSTVADMLAALTGQGLDITVNWVGPTRELITESTSVRLAKNELTVALVPSLNTDRPGIEFGVFPTVTSVATLLPVDDLPVSLQLYRNRTDAAGNETAALEAVPGAPSCSTVSGDKNALSTCRFKLPAIGSFVLVGCLPANSSYNSAGGGRNCARLGVGRNLSSWQAQPLSQFDAPTLTLDRVNYTLGDTATLSFENPSNGSWALVQWGNALLQKQLVTPLSPGLAVIRLPLGEECCGGCKVAVVLSAPRQATLQALPVPTSLLFDPTAPNVQRLDAYSASQTDIKVPDEQRSFSSAIAVQPGPQTDTAAGNLTAVSDGLPVLAPGDSATVLVSMQLPPGYSAPSGSSAIATIIIVDKAILDQVPYPLPDLSQPLALDLSQSITTATSLGVGLIAPYALQNMTAANLRRLSEDPWIQPNTAVQPSSSGQGPAAIDIPDNIYLSQYASPLTVFPGLHISASSQSQSPPSSSSPTSSNVVQQGSLQLPTRTAVLSTASPAPASAPGTVTADAGPSPGDPPAVAVSGSRDTVTPRIQSTFVPTVLVQTVPVDPAGMASVNFTAPQKLSTYVVRAYSATNTAQHSSNETEVQVARQISLTPSAPRLVRIGDQFEAGAVATLRSSEADSIPVVVDLSGQNVDSPIKLKDGAADTPAFILNSTAPSEVRFPFVATAIGAANFTLTILSEGSASDSLEITIPVEGLQEPVRTATSFPVQAVPPNATAPSGPFQGSAQEGLAVPAAAPGSGSIDVTAGVGHLPAVKAIAADLAEGKPQADADYRATWALAALLARSVLELYEGAAAGDSVLSAANASAVAALSHLGTNALTNSTYGLLSSPPQPGLQPPQSADVHLNAWGLWIASQLEKSGPLDASVEQLRPTWQSAMIRQLLKDAQDSRGRFNKPYDNLEQLAEVHLALNTSWLPAVCPATGPCATKQVQGDLAMDRVEQDLDRLSLRGRALAALAWLEVGSPAALEKARRAVRLSMSDIRAGGRTAYIASSPGSQDPADLESQALALLAATQVLSGNTTADPLVEKLANYVAARQGYTGAGPIPFAFGGELAAATMLALQEYDLSEGSIQPNMTLKVRSGNITLLDATFQGDSTPSTVSNNVSYSALRQPQPDPVTFTAVGMGQASVALSLDFVPNATFPFPIYHGLQVERVIRLTDPANLTAPPIGPALATIPLDSIVAFTVRLTTPDQLGPSQMDVLMPGGLEPLDPNINTALGSSCVLGNLSISFAFWPWPLCPVQETLPAAVTFKYQALMPGTQEVTFRAVAASVGNWRLPLVKAFVADQPEVMGLSAAGAVEVCDGCSAGPATAAAAPSKACPGNCSGAGGLCNLATGVCLCNPGYSGDDCSQVTIF
ncbi:hypothetical protein WJX72_010340 [[Myrmecia] bisecta]|uniref:EGF-like domain-containing protein n=1 Tax=[Myrmecia] bisecta TaxID=41462 RepID=A0AAW1P0H9_9CHLO